MQSGMETPHSERDPLLAHGIVSRGNTYATDSELEQGKTQPRDGLKPLTDNTHWQRAKYYLPFLEWLPNYSLSLLSGDVLAGITVASVLIPQSVSYATSLAKLSPLAGLFSAVIPGMVYALLGTSRQLNVAPEASLSLLVGQAVSGVLNSDPHTRPHDPEDIAIAVTTIITFQVGLFSFVLGFFRFGFLDVVLSRALLRGFITAIAVVILIEQLIPLFGLATLERAAHPVTTLDKIAFVLRNVWAGSHALTTLVSAGALGTLVLARWLKGWFVHVWWIYRIPEVLVVVIVSTVLSWAMGWDDDGVAILGAVPIKDGHAFFNLPLRHATARYMKQTTSIAILISVVGFLDSIVAAKQNASRFGHAISPNRELVALGASNLAASFVPGTLPAFGSITRSRINGDVGGRSQMASIVCSTVILLATFFLLPWLYHLPKCVLAAVICLVVYSLLVEAPHDVRYYWRMGSWADFALMGVTFFGTIFWTVEVGIICSVILSLLLLVHKSSIPRLTILGRIPGTKKWKPVHENPEAEDVHGALIVRIRGDMDFANTAQMKERLRRLELYGAAPSHPSEAPRREQAEAIVFHLYDVDTCDASAALIFYEVLEVYKSRGVVLYMAHIRPGLRATFERAGIVDLVGADAFVHDVASAMMRIEVAELAAARAAQEPAVVEVAAGAVAVA